MLYSIVATRTVWHDAT